MRNFKEAFGARIKELRRMRGLTQEELAEMIEINPRQLTRVEKGENFASADTIARLSVSLGVRVIDLFDFEWNEKVTMLATGTDDVPVLRLVQKDEKVRIQATQEQIREMDIPKQIDVASTEDVMSKTAQRMKKALTVEYFNDKTRKYIKTYHPNGEIEVNISEKNIESEDIQSYIKDKMRNYSNQMEKLEFIKLAVDAISSSKSLNELKILLKGMELAQNSSR